MRWPWSKKPPTNQEIYDVAKAGVAVGTETYLFITGEIMATLQQIQADEATLAQNVGAAVTAINNGSAQIVTLQQQVADLTAQLANGVAVTQADLDAIDAGLTDANTKLGAAVAPPATP